MSPSLAADSALVVRLGTLAAALRAGERVAALFFVYLAGLAWVRNLGPGPKFLLPCLAIAICILGSAETARGTRTTRALRDWLSMGLILAAYWSVGLFVAPPFSAWQERWVEWDRVLLNHWGLRAAIESAGAAIPTLLEIVYLLLYAIPPLCVGVLYRIGGREAINRFLFVLLAGTLSAYALLAVLPVHGPYIVYRGLDEPNIPGWGRAINLWVLDHMDIATSVFPSGHVAVAFSSAFGMMAAVPRRRAAWAAVFAAAAGVYVATIFCRYHYTVDGLASILLVTAIYAAARRRDLLA